MHRWLFISTQRIILSTVGRVIWKKRSFSRCSPIRFFETESSTNQLFLGLGIQSIKYFRYATFDKSEAFVLPNQSIRFEHVQKSAKQKYVFLNWMLWKDACSKTILSFRRWLIRIGSRLLWFMILIITPGDDYFLKIIIFFSRFCTVN
jgi:hypothetical protein